MSKIDCKVHMSGNPCCGEQTVCNRAGLHNWTLLVLFFLQQKQVLQLA